MFLLLYLLCSWYFSSTHARLKSLVVFEPAATSRYRHTQTERWSTHCGSTTSALLKAWKHGFLQDLANLEGIQPPHTTTIITRGHISHARTSHDVLMMSHEHVKRSVILPFTPKSFWDITVIPCMILLPSFHSVLVDVSFFCSCYFALLLFFASIVVFHSCSAGIFKWERRFVPMILSWYGGRERGGRNTGLTWSRGETMNHMWRERNQKRGYKTAREKNRKEKTHEQTLAQSFHVRFQHRLHGDAQLCFHQA